MAEKILDTGDKLHIMTRRLFEDDIRRHFVGEVKAVDHELVAVHGYTFIFNTGINEYRRLPEKRTRIFSVADAGNIVNKLPVETDVEKVGYRVLGDRLVVTDDQDLCLSINEFGTTR
jgi:hypothetical protein